MPPALRVGGALPRMLTVAILYGASAGAPAEASSIMFKTEPAQTRSYSGIRDPKIVTSLLDESFDSRISVTAERPAAHSLGALDKNAMVAAETGRVPALLTGSAMASALVGAGLLVYVSRRKRLSAAPAELSQRRFQGRLQTAFSWRDTDHPPLAEAE